jgi:SAM-dependent methyltransferase
MNNNRNDASDPKLYWENRLNENFGLHGTGFIGLGRQYNNWMYKLRRKIFLRIMGSMDIDFSKAEVLDVGSGTGFYISRWKELGVKKINGTDITNIAVRNLKQKYVGEIFYELDITDDNDVATKLDDKKYDIISAFDVLYHVIDDKRYQKAIENIHGLLRPDGIFLISENFLHNGVVRGENQVSRSLSDIEKKLHMTGFDIIRRTPVFILMNYPIDSDSNLRKLLWRAAMFLVNRNEAIGFLLGACLYPIDLMLTSISKESPTTEFMVCRKTKPS